MDPGYILSAWVGRVSVAALPAALDRDLSQCGWPPKGSFLLASGLAAQPCLFSDSYCMCGCECVYECVCICVCLCISVGVGGLGSFDFLFLIVFVVLISVVFNLCEALCATLCMKSAKQIKIDRLIDPGVIQMSFCTAEWKINTTNF